MSALAPLQAEPSTTATSVGQITYTHEQRPEVPWSIHIVRAPRSTLGLEVHAAEGGSRTLGLATVTDLVATLNSGFRPLAAINGDFYQRQGSYAGDPRGLEIIEGELISAPAGGTTFWLDASGQPHIDPIVSELRVSWPGQSPAAIGLNEPRSANAIVLYTSAVGTSTHTTGGRELVLEGRPNSAWLPLKPGKAYRAYVAASRDAGNAPLSPQDMVLSIGPGRVASLPVPSIGAELEISSATTPSLRGVKTAVSGGPILVHDGKAQRIRVTDSDSYQNASAYERHPRSAVGWNEECLFFIEVDGRQPLLSVGMTLQELANFLVKLGCREAMNLDGGGSATLWYAGEVRNHPCDGRERPVANALILGQRKRINDSAAVPLP